jgi:hypothetical protein
MVASPMAAIALNIFGIVNVFMHLLLRSNADNMAIRPVNAPWRKTRCWRFFGSTDLDTNMAQHITTPIGLERNNSLAQLTGKSHEKNLNETDLETGQSPSLHSDYGDGADRRMFPGFAQFPNAPVAAGHSRKMSNYSIFPPSSSRGKGLVPRLSAWKDEGNNSLLPPRPSFIRRHTRFSSDISSATVQIGLRLSNVATPSAQGPNASSSNLSIMSPARLTPTRTQPSTPFSDTPHDSCTLDLPLRLDGMVGSERSSSRIGEKIQSFLSTTRYTKRRSASLSGLSSPLDPEIANGSSMKVLPPPPLFPSKAKKNTPNPQPEASPREPWPLPDGLLLLPNKKYEPTKSWI